MVSVHNLSTENPAVKLFKCILGWLGQRKYYPAAEIGAETVRTTAEAEILHKITKAFSAGLARQLLSSIYYKYMDGCLLLQIICLDTLDSSL